MPKRSEWKRGPVPNDAYGWGGVVLQSQGKVVGFHFADFHGTYVIIDPGTERERRVENWEIKLYDNSLVPPTAEDLAS